MAWNPIVVSLIVAHDAHGAIGRQNRLPWHLKKDLALFKTNTKDKAVVMGRKTAESIGRALPHRQNLVLTRSGQAPYPGQEAVASLEEALSKTKGPELCIVGGSEVYRLGLASGLVNVIKRTIVHTTIPDADAFFPARHPLFEEDHTLLHQEYCPIGDDNPLAFTYEERAFNP